MSKTRLYIQKKLSFNLMVHIKDKQHHFLKNVLRIKIQDTVSLFDGITGEWESTVISINRDNTVLQILKKNKDFEIDIDIWLIFAPIKSHRMSISIQKATELGIARLIPCITQNTNQTKINIRNLNMNIIEAAEQSERLSIPILDEITEMNDLLDNFPSDRGLVFCNEINKDLPMMHASLIKNINKYKKWAIIIGPEGGFTKEEENKISALSSTISVSLGKRILRSDTAATASIFLLQSFINN
ncbi:16S rRNA (uracil(1498)-N(3))-methyltransferase [Pelagibacteraceae bacterium]|nr:16S rRNA (uracil(1498)-N(3))-methyltransferase [Pelagibacteraceae bacterium]